MITRFRIGTYIDDEGSEMWQVERYYDDEHSCSPDRWILYQSHFTSRPQAIAAVNLFRKKEAHTPKWKEI